LPSGEVLEAEFLIAVDGHLERRINRETLTRQTVGINRR
jgi:hypothetical protein